jgi:autotransporter-associated beta strand protein
VNAAPGGVTVQGGTIAPTGTNSLVINGNMNFSTAGSAYLWNLSNNTVASPGINFTAPLQLNGTLSVTTGAIFDMNFAGAVNHTDSFWTNNQSWTVMNGENVSAGTNFSTAFAPGSITTGFLASEFSFITNGNSLELVYTAPITFVQTNADSTNLPIVPNGNNSVIQDGTGTTTLSGSNATALTIIVNNGTLATTNQTATLASLVNVTVNGGTFGVQGAGSNSVNNFTVNGGTVVAASNAIIVATNPTGISITGGTLSGGSYQAANYVFTPSNTATVSAVLGNLNTNSWALIAASNGISGTTVFNSAMTYTGGTLITNATLQMGSDSLTGSIVGLVTNNGVLQNGSGGTLSLTNLATNITGAGIIGQAGSGTLTLAASALNNFRGSFAVSTNGTLSLTNNIDLGGGTNVYLANSGTFQVGGSVTNLTTPVVVTNGTGIVENAGTGTLVFNAPLTKLDRTLVLSGNAMQVNSAIIGSNGLGVFDSDLVISNSAAVTITTNEFYFGPTIVEAGAILNNGVSNALPTTTVLNLGTSVDSGTNIYNLSGYSQSIAGLASPTNAGSFNMVTNSGVAATLTLNGTTNTVYGGFLGGNLALIRSGTGAITLTQNNTYNGGTTISSGKIVTTANSSLGSGKVAMSGGELEIHSLLNIGSFNWSGGQVAIPTLTSTNGVYLASTNGLTIPGGSHVFNLSGASLTIGTPTRLLGATNMSTNSFSTNEFTVTGVGNYSLLISNDILWIDLLNNPAPSPTAVVYPNFVGYAINRNQTNVATALNSFTNKPTADQTVVLNSLQALTNSPASMQQAFNAIMPNFYQQMATIAFNGANAQNMELNQRLWGMRVAQGGGFSMTGFADNTPFLQEGQGDGEGKGVLDAKKDILRPGLDNRWGMFLDANGIFASANSANMLPGYQSESGGVTTGLTFKWNKNVATGLYAGYQGTYNKSGANGSGLGVGSTLIDNAVRFGLFGTYGEVNSKGEPLGFYANALAGGAYNNYQAARIIDYPGMNRTANSSPGAGELDTMLAGGYDVKKGNFTFGPTASLQYTYLGANGVNETGAQSLDFNSAGWNSASMLSSVGAHAAYTWSARKLQGHEITVVPQINLNWQHEFMQNPYAINGNLGGTTPNFSNWSAAPLRDTLYTGVGFTVDFADRWNTGFFYNASAGNNNLESQNIFLSAGMKF